jgi:rod shape-determining protein MreC
MLIFSRYTWWAGAMLGLAMLLTATSSVGVLNPVQNLFLSAAQPVEIALGEVFRPVAAVLSDAGDLNALREENRQLRLENEELRNQTIVLQQDTVELDELRQALGIQQGAEDEKLVLANIVHRDSSPFTDVIRIDKGTNDGVQAGMVVLSAQGSLMGSVTSAKADTAFVRLITDSRSKVAAQVEGSRADGLVRGAANRTLTLQLGPKDIKVGDTIVTSALTGRYPEGQPIGRVTDVKGSPQDLHPTVTLEPFVRTSTAQTVLVLTSFIPASGIGEEAED